MYARAILGATAAIAALSLAACRSAESARTAAGSSSAVDSAAGAGAASVVTITATDFAFDAPAEVPGGLTTIRLVNQGPSLHHVQLIKLDEGKTVDDMVAALKAGGPPPKWASMAGGPNPPEPGSTSNVTMQLEPGNYAMVCFVPAADGMPHVMKGMMRPLKVTGPSRAAAEPASDVTVNLVDYDFQLSQPLTAGRHTIRIENGGGQPHELAILHLKPGKTPEDFGKWGEKPVGPAPAALLGGVSAIMPGTHVFVTADLPPGDYAFICFVPDMKDGAPHFTHGMAKKFTVS
jgi:plastocyanin